MRTGALAARALRATVCAAFVEREDGSLVDYYKLLGVKKDASRLEIKAAYYR